MWHKENNRIEMHLGIKLINRMQKKKNYFKVLRYLIYIKFKDNFY